MLTNSSKERNAGKTSCSTHGKFKAIFWDNDGVLVNTEPLYFEVTKQVLSARGITIAKKYYTDRQLKKNESAFLLAEEKGISREEIEKMRDERNHIYQQLLEKHVPVINGVIETLEKLHGKFFMGVVTSSRKDHFDIISTAGKFRKFFDFFITKQDITHEKPNPEPYLLALQKTPFLPFECLVIEDTERGLTSAKSAGLTCYVIPTELSRGNDFSKADQILHNVRELPELIL